MPPAMKRKRTDSHNRRRQAKASTASSQKYQELDDLPFHAAKEASECEPVAAHGHIPGDAAQSAAFRIADAIAELMTTNRPCTLLEQMREDCAKWLALVTKSKPSTQLVELVQTRLPLELQLLIWDKLAEQHLAWLDNPDISTGPSSNYLYKFLAGPEAVVVSRGVWDPNIKCPSFMPPICQVNESLRINVGRAFLRMATFVFICEPLSDSPDEMPWFAKFVDEFSIPGAAGEPGQPGCECVGTVAFPSFVRWNVGRYRDWKDIIMRCKGLQTLVLGLHPRDLPLAPKEGQADRLPTTREFISLNQLDLLFETRIRRIVLVKAVAAAYPAYPSDAARAIVEGGIDDWILALATALMDGFTARKNGSVSIVIDYDTDWCSAKEEQGLVDISASPGVFKRLCSPSTPRTFALLN